MTGVYFQHLNCSCSCRKAARRYDPKEGEFMHPDWDMFQSGHEPVLYLNNPEGMDREHRRRMLDYLKELHENQYDHTKDEENKEIEQLTPSFAEMQHFLPRILKIELHNQTRNKGRDEFIPTHNFSDEKCE